MNTQLRILHLSQMPASPPRFGAQARMHGLLTEMARRAEVTAVSLVDPEFDLETSRRAMAEYCRNVVLVPNPLGGNGTGKRLLQLRSLASSESFERKRVQVPSLATTLQELLAPGRFDVINLEFPYLAHHLSNRTRPPLVLDTHEIAHDLARQMASRSPGPYRRLYGSLNWRKLRREELSAFRAAEGICACSAADERRILADVPGARTRVIPNAANVDHYRSRPGDPAPDGRTVLFFGLLSTFPNIDGVKFLLDEIWPRIAAARPEARLKIAGANPSAELQAQAGPRVEITGFIEDLRPHLASAAVVVVPLRFGGGTRLKIVEAMAMGRPVVSTRLGAEGIDAVPGKDILLEDEAAPFADAVIRLLDDAQRAGDMGRAGRDLAERKYSWKAAADSLEAFFHEVIENRARVNGGSN
jgi:glycosyltransferase involved in cell wall biosynthesis